VKTSTVAAILILASGCSSAPTPASLASRELKFGARVARKGLWSEARFRFEEAARLAPGDARAHNNLALSQEALGNYAAAFDEYKKALELAPTDREIQKNYQHFAEFYTAYTRTLGKVTNAP
jgi:Tfp pilus assembly protein PilF